uniref:Uncharacterized protein n=1 Tax=Rhizophora mucronata TaxID=61149 RepID=A0A2P2J3R6_RHIMU
MDCILLHLC